MADFVRIADVGPYWERLILWHQFASVGPWWSVLFWNLVVNFTLDPGSGFYFGPWWSILFGTGKNDFKMCRNEFWELIVHVISLWNMNFGLVLSGG